MKKLFFLIVLLAFFISYSKAQDKPRVFVFTDINIDSGDPDDRQSLIHLLWYANELDIEGIVPERWNAKGLEASELALKAYKSDFKNFKLINKGYPNPLTIHKKIAPDWEHGKTLFHEAASINSSPLYVLIWGSMEKFRDALFERPELANNIRLITIGTGLMLENNISHMPKDWEKSPPCKQMNWNAGGRNDIYNEPRFNNMWWVELNWTYEGMFTGQEPYEMFEKLSKYGAMGQHMKDVVKNEAWAQYFRVGDTPSVLYVISPDHDLDNPTESSWAGKFYRPFSDLRPNYYTDFSGALEWDYSNPCKTWQLHEQVKNIAANTLYERRDEMYNSLLKKLAEVYKAK